MPRFTHFAFLAMLLLNFGCEPKAEKPQSKPEAAPAKTETKPTRSVAKTTLSKQSATASGSSLNLRAAIGQLQSRFEESLADTPALVIWIVDHSRSTERLRGEAIPMISALHAVLKKKNPKADFQVGVIAASNSAKWELEPVPAEPSPIEKALGQIATADSFTENLMAAVKLASEKAVEARRAGREATIVLITDEAGDDGDAVDEVLPPLKRFGIPVFVIGHPAPFGRISASAASVESKEREATEIDPKIMHEGPESIEPEVVDLSFSGSDLSLDLMDSGFGPFALEKLCRISGGKYMALRTGASETSFTGIEIRWPDPSATRYSADKMQPYAPDYSGVAEYQALLQSNRAAQALIQAAKLPRIDTLGAITTRFDKVNEAQMKRRLDESQEAAAKIEPGIMRLVEILQPGESDRDKLPSLRWKAGYDLAMGRAFAAKARVDGYNSMLAVLKRGKNFQHPASKSWILEPHDDAIEAGSSIQAVVKKANQYLQRVIEEHPDTPWAEMAQRELETPLGWKWIEQ
jgi:Mg-chelatase subunit ChlD